MITPATLLRDTAVAGLLLAAIGCWWGIGAGAAVAAGAAGGQMSLLLLVWMASSGPVGLLGRVAAHQGVAAVLLFLLLKTFSPVPVLVGFFAVIAALTWRAFLGALRPPAVDNPAESG